MPSYINKSLCDGEVVIKRAKTSLFSELPCFITGAFLFLFLKPLGIAIIILGVIRIITTENALTNHRIISKRGLVKRNTIELDLNRIESILVEQGVIERMLNYGSLFVIGTGGTRTPILYLDHPLAFRKAINDYLSEMRAERDMPVNLRKISGPEKTYHDSTSTEIMRLAELRDKGILTEEEFQSEKTKILNR